MNDMYVYELDGKLYLNLTNRCCNACAFCIRGNADGIKGNRLWLSAEPTFAEVRQQIDAADFTYSEAVFCGYGEPTYALSVLLPAAAYLHELGKTVRLNTNGLGNLICGRDIVPDLVGRIDVVSVSLNAADADGYVALCKPQFGQDAYDALWAFARACAAAGIRTVMTAVDVIDAAQLVVCRRMAEDAGIVFRVRRYISDNESYT